MEKLGFNVDKACSDVTRLRFVSYDPSPYYNENCELYRLPEDFDVESVRTEHDEHTESLENPRLLRVKAYATEWEKKKIALDDYDDWRTIAMSLSNLGEAGYEILDKVSQFSKNYDEADSRKKFNSNPLDDLNERQRKVYNELPIICTFCTFRTFSCLVRPSKMQKVQKMQWGK